LTSLKFGGGIACFKCKQITEDDIIILLFANSESEGEYKEGK
jgi:hypothetical protein